MTSGKTRTSLARKLLDSIGSSPNFILRALSSKAFLFFIFIWFIFQALYIAFSTRQGIPPDENYHLESIRLFSHNGWLPFIHNQAGYYALGEVVHTPFFLYHYLFSLPNHLFGSSELSVYLLRILNILMAVGSLLVTYRLAKFLKLPRIVRNLSIFMLSNTLMFVFLSASISYDNLLILLSLSSILLLLMLLEKPSLFRFQLLAICLISGLLTKVNFIPLAFILIIILAIKFGRDFKKFIKILRSSYTESQSWNIVLAVLLVLLSLLFCQRYAVNLVRYYSYTPRCNQTLTLKQCRENNVFARDERLNNMTHPPAIKSSYEYTADWILLMGERTYGIFAHKSAEPIRLVTIGVFTFFVLSVIALIRKYRIKDVYINLLLLITAFYTIVLMLDNHNRYQRYGSFTFAVQGRYLFAVLPIIYIIAGYYIWRLLKRPGLRLIYILCVVMIFTLAGLPSYIYNTGPDWYNHRAININQHIKSILLRASP